MASTSFTAEADKIGGGNRKIALCLRGEKMQLQRRLRKVRSPIYLMDLGGDGDLGHQRD